MFQRRRAVLDRCFERREGRGRVGHASLPCQGRERRGGQGPAAVGRAAVQRQGRMRGVEPEIQHAGHGGSGGRVLVTGRARGRQAAMIRGGRGPLVFRILAVRMGKVWAFSSRDSMIPLSTQYYFF